MSEPLPRFSPRPNRAHEIAWRPFGPAAFDEARRLGRPVLLSVSAVWCHWCHVMDETTYSDARVLDLVRERYLPVRLDRDQRPDVDRVYNQGGWPTTCVLNAVGAVLWGATYVPPDAMAHNLEAIARHYAHDPDLAARLPPGWSAAGPAGSTAAPEGTGPGTAAGVVDALLTAIAGDEDADHGGFGRHGAKFPQAGALWFLDALGTWPGPRGETARGILHRALAGMAAGGMEDPVEGGLYRYATRPDWTVPHYEKMLAENAALASLYLRAGARAGDVALRSVGERALAYMDRSLWQDSVQAYGGSQDADEAYAAADAAARAGLGAPFVDPVVYAAPNLAAVEALLDGWAVTGDEGLCARALRLWDGLWARLYRPGAGIAHFDAGEGPRLFGQAADLGACLVAGAAVAWLGRPEERDRLAILAGLALDGVVAADGTVVDARVDADPLPAAVTAAAQAAPVADAGLVALGLVRAGRVLGRQDLVALAGRVVDRWADRAAGLGTFGGELGRAAAELRAPLDVRVACAPESGASGPGPWPFVAAVRRSGVSPAVVTVVPADGRAAAGLPTSAHTAAYLCTGGRCGAPIGEPARLVEEARLLLYAASPQAVW